MRVLLVGTAAERGRLRERLGAALTVVAEYATLGAARSSDAAADAILVAPRRREDAAQAEALTAREIEVLEQLAEGLSNKAIAARLAISDQTVKFHVASIAGKLGAANRTQAVRTAIRRGIITV
jgi:DNA-binding NarL/FixJ family response regulator